MEWAGIGKKKGVKTLSKPYKTKNATLDYYIFMFGKTKGIKEYNKHLILHKRTQQAKRKIIFSTNNDDIYTVDNWGSFYDYSSYDNSNRANQLNPNNNAYWQSRGYDSRPENWQNISGSYSSNAAMNNHANQMNPNNAAYHSSRGGK